MKIKLFFLLTLVTLQAKTQSLNFEAFDEDKLAKKQLKTVPLKDGSILRIFMDDEKKEDFLSISIYNQYLKKEETKEVSIHNKSEFTGVKFDSDSSNIYIIAYSKKENKGNLVKYNIKGKSLTASSFEMPELTDITEFEYCESYFFIMMTKRDKTVSFYKYKLDMTSPEELIISPSNSKDNLKFSLHFYKYFFKSKELILGYSMHNELEQTTELKILKDDDSVFKTIQLDKNEKKFYINFTIQTLGDTSIFVTGSYNKNNSATINKIYGGFSASTGLFFSFINRRDNTINTKFKSYCEIKRIYNHIERKVLRENEENKLIKENKKGNTDFIELQTTVPKLIFENNKLTLFYKGISGWYYYGGGPSMGGGMYTGSGGGSIPTVKLVMILDIDLNGEILNSNTYPIENYILNFSSDGINNPGNIFAGMSFLDLQNENIINFFSDDQEINFAYLNVDKVHLYKISRSTLDTISTSSYDFKYKDESKIRCSLSDSYFYSSKKFLIFGNTGGGSLKIVGKTFLLKLSTE